MGLLKRDDVLDLLNYIGVEKIRNFEYKDDIQFCCPVHGEKNPSMGFSIEKGLCNCFSCGFSGGANWLLFKSLPDEIKSIKHADEFILKRYGVNLNTLELDNKRQIPMYGQSEKQLAVRQNDLILYAFDSGKETYEYFFHRGFTIQSMKDFEVGRDLVQRTITIPLRNEYGEFIGDIGRKIDRVPHNARYLVYNFKKSDTLFPLNKYVSHNKQVILVEGILDAMYMHQLGYTNCLAILGDNLSKFQKEWLLMYATSIISMLDNDERGKEAAKRIREEFKYKIMYGMEYPDPDIKDACNCTPKQIENMIKNKRILSMKS